MAFNIGDKVMMNRSGHEAWGVAEDNPKGMEGEIIEVDPWGGFMDFRVRWANGTTNSYEEADLDKLD